jgi:photosystem II stability/assembly factor-like uncharacterized protein
VLRPPAVAIWLWLLTLILSASASAQWQSLPTHSAESLRGLGAFNGNLAWASGTHGTYLFTTNGGQTWTAGKVPGAESLDFRGVQSFGFDAFLLAAGPGDQSRIYHTTNLGDRWDLQFVNREPSGFLDCMAFSDGLHGVVVGDPVNGKFQILRTHDGGKSWRYSDPRKMPAAVAGEGAFAASNSCITTQGRRNVWFVTGGGAARVFRSTDGGKSWKVSVTPIAHGEASAGIFSVAFFDKLHGTIAGGDYRHPETGGLNLAATEDGGKTWRLVQITPQKFFSAITYVSGHELVAVAGSSASAFSRDGLRSWDSFFSDGFNALSAPRGAGVLFAAGANGRVSRMSLGDCASCESVEGKGH